MRYLGCALGTLLLVSGQALAAEPATPAPAKPATPAPAKPATPAPATPAPATPPPAAAAPGTPPKPAAPPPLPKAGDAPPPEYYVEPGFAAPGAGAAAPPVSAAPGAPPPDSSPPPGPPGPPPPPPDATQIYEPPPPGFFPGDPVYEPPPPPEPHHLAPRTALWLGARVGWFIPFGNVWARRSSDVSVSGVPWSDYASSGPMFELDAGVRLARNYSVFALWERARLGSGDGDAQSSTFNGSKADHGETDFWGVGIRASSDPDQIGFITELAVGYRRAQSKFDNGDRIQFTDAPFEARLGVGAEFRINRSFTLSPLLTLGVGQFDKVESVSKGEVRDETTRDDRADGHAWATFTLGGHFDLLPSRR